MITRRYRSLMLLQLFPEKSWLILVACLLATQLACSTFTSEELAPTPSLSPNPTHSTPNPAGTMFEKLEYRNEAFGFSFLYPSTVILTETADKRAILLIFPLPLNTNLIEERLEVKVQNSPPCRTSLAEGREPGQLNDQSITINDLNFLRQNFTGAATGTTTEMVAYLTERDEICISFDFLLRTFDPGNLDPTAFPDAPTMIDGANEIELFEEIVSTFSWLR